ncbi:hypothetical protein [Paenibacillus sp. BK720]|uniref:hypothetical protein n=1 Tax=Paenibacillus sp. BK720 TaxID=2587092 RepID=UPI00141E57FA|nr:hypothetical protein [Paenibacillus sp. BK720]NIK67926.1 hypothetical protein [Paenibacillus sp. BK720]
MTHEEAWNAYLEKFGEEPPLMGIGDSMDNIMANVEKAVKTGKPLWTFYYDKNPADSDISI